MSIKLELKIAGRYLRARRKEGFASLVVVLSFIGIMLGVATLIVTMAVMNGVKSELINRIIGINAHISVGAFDGSFGNYSELVEKIGKVEGVTKVNPAIQGQALAVGKDDNIGLVVKGILKEDIEKKEVLSSNILAGKIYENDSFSTIVGSSLARQANLSEGAKLKLLSPNFSSSFFGSIPRVKEFDVSAVFHIGMYEYDSSVIFISLDAAQKFFGMGDKINSIDIEVVDPKNMDEIKNTILKLLGQGMYITDWRKTNSSFIEAIDVQSNVLFLILALIILVAAFNIISGMVMLVGDKNGEIAILRTIGMHKNAIIRIFIICGAVIGIAGTLFGVGLGLAFSANIEEIRRFLESLTSTNLFSEEIYFLSQLPADVRQSDVINITALSLIISLLSTIYPAYKAAKIQPAMALKYE